MPIFYWRSIAAVLGLKAVGLALLYLLFFAPADRPDNTDGAVARHMLQAPGRETP